MNKWIIGILVVGILSIGIITCIAVVGYDANMTNNMAKVYAADTKAYNTYFTVQKTKYARVNRKFDNTVEWADAILQYLTIVKSIDVSDCPLDFQEAFQVSLEAHTILQKHIALVPSTWSSQYECDKWHVDLDRYSSDLTVAENKKRNIYLSYGLEMVHRAFLKN